MPDPTTHTITAAAVGASSASIAAGTFLGIEYVVLGVALLGASIAHIYLERMEFRRMLAAIFGSFVIGVMVAKLSAPAVIATAEHFAPWLNGALSHNTTEASALIAFLVSFTAQKTVPRLFGLIEKKEA